MNPLMIVVANSSPYTCDINGSILVDRQKHVVTSIKFTPGMATDVILLSLMDWYSIEISLAAEAYSHADYFTTYMKVTNAARENFLIDGPDSHDWSIDIIQGHGQVVLDITLRGTYCDRYSRTHSA